MSERLQYSQCLEDQDLFDKAIATEGGLAVPVGGTRRGGYCCPPSIAACKRTKKLLSEHDGFPNLRIKRSDDEEVCHNVVWGDEPPSGPDWDDEDAVAAFDVEQWDRDCGHFYGYSEAAIQRYIDWQASRHH